MSFLRHRATLIFSACRPSALCRAANGLSITLNWTGQFDQRESGFQIQRSTDNGAHWMTIATAPSNSTSSATYLDSTVSQGTTYTYQISAVNASGASAFSNTASASIIPAAPTGLTASAASATAMNLSWIDNSLGETSLHLQRSLDGSTNWTDVPVSGAFTQSVIDTGLSAATIYYYRIVLP